jgi:integrase/recombinase XerD
VERFISRRRRGGPPSAATSNRDLSTIRSFYSWCTAKGFVEVSPAVLVHAPTRHRRQPKPIPDGVWQAWWGSELPDGLRLVLGLGFYGGLRRAEIMGLHTRNIQGRKIVDFVRKGGGEHTVPLADMTDILVDRLGGTVGDPQLLWDVLGDSVRRGGWVVKYVVRDPQELNRRINKWSIKSGLPRFTPHQLRHSAASNLVRAGVPLHLTASLLNHSNIQITMGYVSSGGEQLAEWKKSLVNDNKLS